MMPEMVGARFGGSGIFSYRNVLQCLICYLSWKFGREGLIVSKGHSELWIRIRSQVHAVNVQF